MSSAMSFLFGSQPSVQNFTPNLVSTLDPNQEAASYGLIGSLQLGQATFPDAVLGTAPTSGLQNISLDALQNFGSSGGAAGPSSTAQSTALDRLTSIMNAQAPDLQSYYNTNVFQPLQHTFETSTLPSIVSALGGNQGGPQSTAATTAVTEAGKNFTDTLAQTQSQLALQQNQLTTQNALTAAGQVPGAAASPINTLLSVLGAGGVPQQIAQAGLTNAYTSANQANTNVQQQIADLLTFLGTPQTTTSTAVANPGSSGLINNLLSAVAGAATRSDQRVKKDITKVGKTDTGLPLYLFRYKEESKSTPRHLGVMAQDVQKKRPDAVYDLYGTLVVDYLKALAPKEKEAA